MKKLVSLVLCLAFALSLAACEEGIDGGYGNIDGIPSGELSAPFAENSSTADSTADNSSAADVSDSGTLGTLNWSFANGTLTIGGSGALGSTDDPDDNETYPWDKYQNETKTLAVEGGIEEIGDCVFNGYTALESVSFPTSLKKIGFESFSGCIALKKLVLPEGVTGLNDGSFSGCTSLESISIPSTLKDTDTAMFARCTSLKSITVASGNPYLYADKDVLYFEYYGHVMLLQYPIGKTDTSYYTVPDGVTEISAGAFAGSKLQNINLPASLTYIGYNAFADCPNLKTVNYSGTVEQIKAIEFGSDWYKNSPFPYISCVGGGIFKPTDVTDEPSTPDEPSNTEADYSLYVPTLQRLDSIYSASYRNDFKFFGSNSGVLYDLDGDGVKELVVQYFKKTSALDGNAIGLGVYTIKNGAVVTVTEQDIFAGFANTGMEYMAVTEKDGTAYVVCAAEGNYSGAPEIYSPKGNWYAYSYNGSSLTQASSATYNYTLDKITNKFTPGSATIDGVQNTYNDFEAYKNSYTEIEVITKEGKAVGKTLTQLISELN